MYLNNIEWGACTRYHIEAFSGAQITKTGNDTILTTGTLNAHIYLGGRASLGAVNKTTTLISTPNFGYAFIAVVAGDYDVWNHTFVGSATGQRYNCSLNGTINTFGKGPNHFPGDVAGVTLTGGQYA